MKRIIVIATAIILLISFAHAQENVTITKETQAIYNSIEKHSVQIFMVNQGYCTGTVLSNEGNATVLTCKHCIVPSEETRADYLKTKLIITSGNDDLAYLIMDGFFIDKVPAKLGNYYRLKGEEIYIYGKQGLAHTFTSKGIVIRLTDDWAWSEMEAIPGCSGSGVFNKKSELIGVLGRGMIDRGKNITIFEPLFDIKKFLKEVEQIIK